jgi:hypothetical protein
MASVGRSLHVEMRTRPKHRRRRTSAQPSTGSSCLRRRERLLLEDISRLEVAQTPERAISIFRSTEGIVFTTASTSRAVNARAVVGSRVDTVAVRGLALE